MAKFPQLAQPVIIAMKGLPFAGKSEIGRCLGQWERCPVLYIDHYLDTLSLQRRYGFSKSSLPSPDEVERLHRLAFDGLCKAASDCLRWGKDSPWWGYKSVIIKSRLSSTFELDRLVQLARECGCVTILIIELHTDNEHRVRNRLDHKLVSGEQKEWYKPRSWNDIDKFRDGYEANSWDLHLHRLLDNCDETGDLPRVRRLVLDPFDHVYLFPYATLTDNSTLIIDFLLTGHLAGQSRDKEDPLLEGRRYEIFLFDELGRYIREKELRHALSRKRYFMYPCTERSVRQCTFKYWEKLPHDLDECIISYYCGVCEELVALGQPAYACYFCTLTLHKLCAEMPTDVAIEGFEDIGILRLYSSFCVDGDCLPLPREYACNKEHKDFSPKCIPCLFQTHLRSRALPTILSHESHEHFLRLGFQVGYHCKACGAYRRFARGTYGCYICCMSYDVECISLVREVEHEHGGHRHSLKLTYSHHGMEKEEDIWCGLCYEDMDPQNWFYSCQDCPYFAAHTHCVRLSGCTDRRNFYNFFQNLRTN